MARVWWSLTLQVTQRRVQQVCVSRVSDLDVLLRRAASNPGAACQLHANLHESTRRGLLACVLSRKRDESEPLELLEDVATSFSVVPGESCGCYGSLQGRG